MIRRNMYSGGHQPCARGRGDLEIGGLGVPLDFCCDILVISTELPSFHILCDSETQTLSALGIFYYELLARVTALSLTLSASIVCSSLVHLGRYPHTLQPGNCYKLQKCGAGRISVLALKCLLSGAFGAIPLCPPVCPPPILGLDCSCPLHSLCDQGMPARNKVKMKLAIVSRQLTRQYLLCFVRDTRIRAQQT